MRTLQNIRMENKKDYDVGNKIFLIEKYLNSIQDNNEQKTSQIDRKFQEENGGRIVDKKICVTISMARTKSLSDFLIPQKFDTILQATEHVSNVMTSDVTSRPEFKTRSLALRIGNALKKCVSMGIGVAFRAGNIKWNEALTSFLHLMEVE
ncbi:hypothetical protein JTB14_034036 [Gonioctena quinquepunctata]|nr:hypothetical protein JTB14_034036 [Gonioctena quinquepunctata]